MPRKFAFRNIRHRAHVAEVLLLLDRYFNGAYIVRFGQVDLHYPLLFVLFLADVTLKSTHIGVRDQVILEHNFVDETLAAEVTREAFIP